jgi:DNA-binding NtrC family response regulator
VKSDTVRIIAVARDGELANRIRELFAGDRAEVCRESTIDRVIERFESEPYDVLLITSAAFKAGEIDGIEMLEVIAAKSPGTQVLFLVEPRDIGIAMSALKAGTYQYAKLPIGDDELRLLIETAVEKKPRYSANLLLKTAKGKERLEQLLGKSDVMQHVYRQIRQAAATDIPVLLMGETGTGKDLAARAIHQQSSRSDAPFIAVNLGAVPTELVASELFGHEKGAFTGALDQRQGKFEQARGGTIFLDEIGAIDEKVQVSLLRLIEQNKFQRLGGRRTISTDVRLIAASNEDLVNAVHRGSFRQDLYYRLDVFRVVMPPLRERQGDIPLLINEFLRRYNRAFQKSIVGIAPEFLSRLELYGWPGNVRELKNVIQRAVLVATGETLLPQHLPPRFRPDAPERPKVTFEVGATLDEIEREMIVRTLAAAKNNKKRAAELLGISRRALYNKLHKHGIT